MSSICLMACAVTAFDQLKGSVPEDRDDLALRAVCEKLSGLLAGEIPNPVVEAACLDSTWSPEQRESYRLLAAQFHRNLCGALELREPVKAVELLRSALGPRVPGDPSLVCRTSTDAEIVRRPATVMSAPIVSRSTSG
jgi:hypothetical protein